MYDEYLKKLDFDGAITLDDDLQQDILDIKKIFIQETNRRRYYCWKIRNAIYYFQYIKIFIFNFKC